MTRRYDQSFNNTHPKITLLVSSYSLPLTSCTMDFAHGLSDRLLLAVPKKGRLNQSCLDLLSGSDIKFHRHSRRDIALVKNLPIALVFLPAADIPTFVGEGRVDFGITGRDQVAEHFDRRARSPDEDQLVDSSGVPVEVGVKELLDLGFGGCKLQVQVPADGSIEDPKDLVGKSVATSFTNLTEHYFRKLEGKEDGGKLSTKIITITGSVETACALGLASGIVDLVESGETMREAGLKPIATVMETSAVLIANKRTKNPKLVELVTSRIAGVLSMCPVDKEEIVTDRSQPHNAMFSWHTTSTARNWKRPNVSLPASARQRSKRWRRTDGWPSVSWLRRAKSLLSWTRSWPLAVPTFLPQRLRTRELPKVCSGIAYSVEAYTP